MPDRALPWIPVIVAIPQVSVLRVFHQLLASASFRKQPGSSDILRFAMRIVNHIFERLVPLTAAETSDKLRHGE